MATNFYRFDQRHQPNSSWVLFELTKSVAKHVPRPELPPVMYQFFGPQPEGTMRIKPEYLEVCCRKCGRYDYDDVFEIGFSEPALIRVKGDISHTRDRVLVVSDRFLSVVKMAKVGGYKSKPIGNTGWHAFLATERVGFRDGVMKMVKPICTHCKRAKTTTGMFENLSQMEVPKSSNTFFTTNQGWPTMLWDRWIFATEEVVQALKAAGIRGGCFNRLWTDEEVVSIKEKAKQGKRWTPPRSSVLL